MDKILRMRYLKIPMQSMDSSGFEPEASRVQGGRSTRLIYEPFPDGSFLSFL